MLERNCLKINKIKISKNQNLVIFMKVFSGNRQIIKKVFMFTKNTFLTRRHLLHNKLILSIHIKALSIECTTSNWSVLIRIIWSLWRNHLIYQITYQLIQHNLSGIWAVLLLSYIYSNIVLIFSYIKSIFITSDNIQVINESFFLFLFKFKQKQFIRFFNHN